MKKHSRLYLHLEDFVSAFRLALPMVLASVVGAGTGLLAVGFIKAIAWIEKVSFTQGTSALGFLGPYAIILIPALGGLLVGPLVTFLAPEAKGHGVPEVLKAIVLKGGRIRPVVVVVKAIASALAIGTGASVGREGPIVQVGAALGSTAGQVFKLTESRTKNLVACGAAAGISSVFNAPIAGVMFASEVILKDFGARALSTIVVAAVSAGVVSRIFLGEWPAFTIPSYSLSSPFEIFLYLGLGVLAALAAHLFMFTLHKSEDLFDRWKFPNWLKPFAGGLVIGMIGFYFPHIFGTGLKTIGDVLHGDLALNILFLLIFLKIIATSVSLGSGSSGGVFAPALFIGAVLGGAVGHLVFNHMPFPVGPSGAYAVAGMASVFAAAAHAPVTAILIVFEMTGDYRMILPIMASVIVATSISQLISRESIYTAKLKERGIDISSLEEARVLGALQVRDAMNKDYETVPNHLPAQDLFAKLNEYQSKSFFVVDQNENLAGFIKPETMQEFLIEENLTMVIAQDMASPVVDYCFPDEPLNEAGRLMLVHRLAFLPVVEHADPKKVIGALKPEDIFRVYTKLAEKRNAIMTRMDKESFVEDGMLSRHFAVPLSSPLVGRSIKEIEIPKGIVFTSFKRRNTVLIPDGNTFFQSKDKVRASLVLSSETAFQDWIKKYKLRLLS